MTISDLNQLLSTYLRTERYPDGERGGFFRTSEPNAPVHRLGLALEPAPELPDWLRQHDFDALWLHRPWKLDLAPVPADLPILFHHLPFDETLTMGFNEPLAAKLSFTNPEALGHKQADGYPPRAIGMLGGVPARSPLDYARWAETEFGGLDGVHEGRFPEITRLAVVGAMNEVLVREAAARGAHLYLTGAYRRGAQRAVEETGLHVLAVGHERSERWGVHALAAALRERVEVGVFEPV